MAKEKRTGKVEEILCPECKQRTKHTIRGTYHTEWSNDEHDMWGDSHHDLMSCNGCDTVTYRRTSWSTEDDTSSSYYPPRGSQTAAREPKDYSYLPFGSPLESVYRQTVTAYNQQLVTLVGAGVRLLIEGICNDRGIKDGEVEDKNGKKHRRSTLEGRINGMVEQGFLSTSQAPTLHEIRFLGNDAAHQLDLPGPTILEAALDIVEHILDQVYEQPQKAKKLAGRKRSK